MSQVRYLLHCLRLRLFCGFLCLCCCACTLWNVTMSLHCCDWIKISMRLVLGLFGLILVNCFCLVSLSRVWIVMVGVVLGSETSLILFHLFILFYIFFWLIHFLCAFNTLFITDFIIVLPSFAYRNKKTKKNNQIFMPFILIPILKILHCHIFGFHIST